MIRELRDQIKCHQVEVVKLKLRNFGRNSGLTKNADVWCAQKRDDGGICAMEEDQHFQTMCENWSRLENNILINS